MAPVTCRLKRTQRIMRVPFNGLGSRIMEDVSFMRENVSVKGDLSMFTLK